MIKKYTITEKNLRDVVKGLPDRSGIYGFLTKEGYYLYIGQSINLRGRVRTHAGKFLKGLIKDHGAKYIVIVEYHRHELDEKEQDAIEIHTPRFNKQYSQDGVMLNIDLKLPSYIMNQIQDIGAKQGISTDAIFREALEFIIEQKTRDYSRIIG